MLANPKGNPLPVVDSRRPFPRWSRISACGRQDTAAQSSLLVGSRPPRWPIVARAVAAAVGARRRPDPQGSRRGYRGDSKTAIANLTSVSRTALYSFMIPRRAIAAAGQARPFGATVLATCDMATTSRPPRSARDRHFDNLRRRRRRPCPFAPTTTSRSACSHS